jgi:outer membrane protein, heavy metal efflux system
MKFSSAVVLTILTFLSATTFVRAQERPPVNSREQLADLLAEAERNNPQIQAARLGWDAAKQVPSQVSTLPDPEVMVQQMSVGSPRPFSGYTNSEMANIALGVSQEIPYPGKLRLRGEIARKEADVWQQQVESVRRAILADVKTKYFRLSYLAKRLAILQDDGQLLKPIEQSAEARFRQGMGSQQDVLQAQLEQTRLLRELAATQMEAGTVQAKLKQLLNRSQSSPEIEVAQLSETPVAYTYEQMLEAAKSDNPDIAGAERMVERQDLQVELAHKDFYPDFNISYTYLRPDPFKYRARYEVSFGVRLPIYRGRRQQPELAQAELEKERAGKILDAQSQEIASGIREQFVIEEKLADLLKIYREGLMPQARAELQAGMAAFQAGREDFQALLASFLDVVKLDEEYWQTLSEHETALAEIEQTTGLSLR